MSDFGTIAAIVLLGACALIVVSAACYAVCYEARRRTGVAAVREEGIEGEGTVEGARHEAGEGAAP